TFSGFLGDRKTLLDPGTPPEGVELAFGFHDEFLLAPEYLGGSALGTRRKEVRVGTWKYVAEAMNFCKTFSLQRTIASIPMEYRVGSAEYRFAFLRFDADWLLTTPAEFRAGAFERLKLTKGDVEDFATVLPSVAATGGGSGGANEEGLVAFLRGEADIGFVKLEAAFGLAASGSMGFDTGFKLAGAIGPLELELDGAVMINSPLAVSIPAGDAKAVTAATPAAAIPASTGTAARGKALSLNGKNAFVQIPASDSLMLPEYTVELWIRPTQKQATEWVQVFGIDTHQGGEQRNCYLELNSKSGFYGHRFKDARGGNAGAPNTPDGSVRWGEWHHVALTNDGATAQTYVNGQKVAAGPVQGGLALLRDSIFIGKVSGSASDRFLGGDIREVRVWKRCRADADVAALMREAVRGDEKDLVSCWRFDSDTGSRAVDLCGRNHGTITNGAFADSDLLLLEGVALNGTGDWLEVPRSDSLKLKAYTVEAWFKPSPMTGEWAGIVGKPGRGHALYIHRTGFVHHRFHDASGTNAGAPNTPPNVVRWNAWNHVAITNDGTTARTFVNGIELAEGPVKGDLVVHDAAVQIGRTADATNDQFFPGTLGEIRIWSRSRSADEVTGAMYRRLAGSEADLVALWRPGESADAVLADACGRNPGVFHVAGVDAPATMRHDGLVFDGKDDYALLPKSDRWKLPQYTVEAWIRPDADPPRSWQCVWGGNGKAPRLYLNSSGAISHRFVATGLTTTMTKVDMGIAKATVPVVAPDPNGVKEIVQNTDAGQVRWGAWNHLAITSDGKTWRTFLNGVEVKSGGVEGNLLAEAVEVNVGRAHDGKPDAFFAGSIDDIRVWSVARTVEQIQAAMNHPLAGNEPGLAAWYDMDHGAGAALVDRGPAHLDGVVYG
ncbi:MAG TPA: LamG domain-containing protein, partial [Longimicrobiaceae bacterium]